MKISSASADSLFSSGRRIMVLALLFTIIFLSDSFIALMTISAETFTVNPEGNLSLSEALSLAGAGDIIFLTDGKYTEPIVTVGGGEEGNPLKIVGTRAAVISGQFRNRAVLVQHSWVTLEGFTVNGTVNSANKKSSYLNKGVYVMGGGEDAPLYGFTMLDMGIHNCGGECVRLKSGIVNAEITDNTITNCGIYYYRFGFGDNNGEGVYIGTAATQLQDLDEPDHCNDNLVSGNSISTNGNECVDIKEGSSGNVVTNNACSWQMDQISAGFNIRGNNNTVEDNTVEDCKGWGVRLGGWSVHGTQYGVNNSVHGNSFKNTGGAFNIRVSPQGGICGNSCEFGSCSIQYNWKYQDEVNEIKSTWDHSCN